MPDEKTHADSIRWYYTGAGSDGAAQTDPDASIGNYRSGTEIDWLGQTLTDPISNLTIDYLAGLLGTGDHVIDAASADELTLTPDGGTVGAAVTIANGETKILEGGTNVSKYARVTRTSVANLTGSCIVTADDSYNNLWDNVSSDEGAAGDDEIRAVAIKNDSADSIFAVKVYIQTIGTQRVSAANQLGAAGAGTVSVTTGTLADWDDSGYCRIETAAGVLREIVYYTSRTATALTVPAAGRERCGTTAAAGAADDLIYCVPGIRIAKEAPSAQATGNFSAPANEGTIPGGLVWSTGITAAGGLSIGDLLTTYIYAVWIRRDVVAASTASATFLQHLRCEFDAL